MAVASQARAVWFHPPVYPRCPAKYLTNNRDPITICGQMNLGWGYSGDGSKEAPTTIPVYFQAKSLMVGNWKNPLTTGIRSNKSEFFTQQVGREHTERRKRRDFSSLAISKTNEQRETTDPGTSETGVRTRESKKMERQQVGSSWMFA